MRRAICFSLLIVLPGCSGGREASQAASSSATADVADTVVDAPAPPPEDTGYIEFMLKQRTGDVPRLGWLVPPNLTFTNVALPEITVVTPDSGIRTARFSRILTSEQRAAVRTQYHVACDADTLMSYELSLPVQTATVIVSGAPFPGRTRLGARRLELTAAQIVEADSLIGATPLAIDSAFGSPAGRTWYSFHARYDTAGQVQRTVLVLRDDEGRILATDVATADAYLCADCDLPRHQDGLFPLFGLLNVLDIPGLAFPVLLLDSSTFEGRARSLVTFTPQLLIARYRLYEYVMTC